MSAIVALFKFKATYGLTDTGFDEMLQIFGDMLPDNSTLLSSFHETKKYSSHLSLDMRRYMNVSMIFVYLDMILSLWRNVLNVVLRGGKLMNTALRLKRSPCQSIALLSNNTKVEKNVCNH